MDLPPSSYHDSLEELWDEEEEPEEIETVMKVVPPVYHQYLDVFSKVKAEKLPPHHTCDHHIEMVGSLPPVGVIYYLSNQVSDTLRAYISENVEKAFIRPQSSSTGATVLFVQKKYGSLYEIIVFSKSEEENFTHVSTVLSRLRANNLFAKASKCLFHLSSVGYLGYIFSSEGLKMEQAKVQKILNWPPPRSLKALQQFLGFANFFPHFIKNYSKKISSLTSYLKKDSHFPLNEKSLRQFNQLKEAFTTAPVLPHFNPSLPTILETDASYYALGAVLNQVSDSGKHPIPLDSCKLLPEALNHDICDKELLGRVGSLKCWRAFLLSLSSSFEVLTNPSSLQYLISSKILTHHQAC
ncbi:hypothetical protein O181_030062 [Austropuccinia psidii MF-1]|uniref:Reverse transcriptase/retrotransposon-derived protein RNase H-like domain-containing protein n=1 Tax=Austropuccinia psidii MF-1 TaxID=1389203 RepID=A0A9Q3H430_9BASI|nr:hypothetical protein [Austropuccinia psidii MF-1]